MANQIRIENKQNNKENILGEIVILLAIVLIVTIIYFVASSKSSFDIHKQCCHNNNATYILYECQCNPSLGLHCDNLTCGSYCKFSDGHLEKVSKINCET